MAQKKPAEGGDFIENLISKFIEATSPSKKKEETEDEGSKFLRPFSARLNEMEETLFKNRQKKFSKEEIERYTSELQTYKEDELVLFKHLSKEIHDMQTQLDKTPKNDKKEVGFLQKHINRVKKERVSIQQVLEQIDNMAERLKKNDIKALSSASSQATTEN